MFSYQVWTSLHPRLFIELLELICSFIRGSFVRSFAAPLARGVVSVTRDADELHSASRSGAAYAESTYIYMYMYIYIMCIYIYIYIERERDRYVCVYIYNVYIYIYIYIVLSLLVYNVS